MDRRSLAMTPAQLRVVRGCAVFDLVVTGLTALRKAGP